LAIRQLDIIAQVSVIRHLYLEKDQDGVRMGIKLTYGMISISVWTRCQACLVLVPAAGAILPRVKAKVNKVLTGQPSTKVKLHGSTCVKKIT
jgi:hypothetical protein